ncbi:hypothetical protein [Microbulbifer epialgicus]|uniref:Uncharacterized protein n=1 Tax=Microbulbifer epialgicus TaxID=393907 RepID=A0ABV4NUV0_9GAMM
MNSESFYLECFEILRTGKPAVVVEVAELIAAGVPPVQVPERIPKKMLQNNPTSMPLLIENAACYLRSVVPIVSGTVAHLLH